MALNAWMAFSLSAFALFVIGAIIIYKEIRELMIIPIFFILGGVLMNAIGHLLISLYVGEYFPGLYTAFILLPLGPILIRRLLASGREYRI